MSPLTKRHTPAPTYSWKWISRSRHPERSEGPISLPPQGVIKNEGSAYQRGFAVAGSWLQHPNSARRQSRRDSIFRERNRKIRHLALRDPLSQVIRRKRSSSSARNPRGNRQRWRFVPLLRHHRSTNRAEQQSSCERRGSHARWNKRQFIRDVFARRGNRQAFTQLFRTRAPREYSHTRHRTQAGCTSQQRRRRNCRGRTHLE